MKLAANNYGKGEVRLVKVVRTPGRHVVRDLTVHVAMQGDFGAAHVSGDNTGLPATDTMRNTVYALAPEHLTGSIEAYGLVLARHFVDTYASVSSARVCEVHSDGAVSAGIEDMLVLKTTNSG